MSEAFLKVVNMSISAGWLVLAVLALRLILKKAPKWVNVLLWGIVAVRLICPFSIESALSLIPSAEVISPSVLLETPEINTGFQAINNAINPVIQESVTMIAPEKGVNTMKLLIQISSIVWITGAALLIVYTAISYLRLRWQLRIATLLRDNIYQCVTVDSPFVLGILKPRIYLPYKMDGQNLAHVVAHEQAHIRRFDHWWKPLGFLLLTIHWFNPLMWVAYILLCRDIELACDEKVIAELGSQQRADYTLALVSCSVNRRIIAACPLAFGEVSVKERVKNVMNYKKPGFWILIIAIVVSIVVAVCFLTDPPMENLKVLPEVHSHSYGIVEVTYESWNDKVPDMNRLVGLRFRVNESMELGMKSDAVSYTDWIELGTFTEITLTKDNFDRICYHDNGWFRGESAAKIRRNSARAWELVLEETEQFFYLIQMNNGELFLAEGYYDTAERDDPSSDDTSVSLLYRIAVDLNEEYNIIAKSGENVVPLTIFPAGTAIGNYSKSIHWLTIDSGEDYAPFRTYQNGEELYAVYNVFDAETYEPIPHMIPSGLEPQTGLFQNADPNREYIVVMMRNYEPDAELYCFGVRFKEKNDVTAQFTGDLIPGTAYVSHECLYMNPLSSYYALGGDSGCRYLIEEDAFVTIWRDQHNFVSVAKPELDTAGKEANNIIPVTKWEWQEFPFTDEAWSNLYFPSINKLELISKAYDEMLYQPLTPGKFLLKMDSELWLVELASSTQTGPYIWSIYSLIPESAMGVAQWEYLPEDSSHSPYFRFTFDMNYNEIDVTCVDSLLVDYDSPDKSSCSNLTIKNENPLYWSPVDQDGNLVSSATIHFTVHSADGIYPGTIYINSNSATDDHRIYTATIVGTGLHLAPNSEQDGGAISFRN